MSDTSSTPSTPMHVCDTLPSVSFVWNHVRFNEDAEMTIEMELPQDIETALDGDSSVTFASTASSPPRTASPQTGECFHLSVFPQMPLPSRGAFADNMDIGRVTFSGVNHAAAGMIVETASELLDNAANAIALHFRSESEITQMNKEELSKDNRIAHSVSS